MVIYERLEIFPSYNALNTFNVCMKVLWRLLSNLSHMGNGQSNCHLTQSSLTVRNVQSGYVGEEDTQGSHELWESRQIYKLVY